MDFALPYSEEQEQFRQEVRTWLKENVPEEMKDPVDPRDFTEEHYRFWRETHQKMAKKGWLYPTFPKEYGGGGLTGDHETIIEEESYRSRVPRNFTSPNCIPSLLVWATEEQKRKFLIPILTAEITCWNKLTEPHSGADLANYKGRAIRDGDDWLLTGQQAFISGRGTPAFLYGPMLTDPDAPRHRNLGYFMIPVPSPGLEIQEQSLLNGNDQHFIFMDGVRIPGDHIIGGDHQGWQVAGTTLESEHGGRGRAFPRDEPVDNLVSYVREAKRNGDSLGSNPMVQQTTMDAYIEAHVDSLLAKRTYWMYQNRVQINHEHAVADVHRRLYSLRNAIRVRDAMGMYALLNSKDSLSPHKGAQEVNQRVMAGQHHAAGSTNIAKVILARRIGISRTREGAAPTPSTAASHTS